MAIVVDNIYTRGISGRIGDDLLYKQYSNKTVVCRFPRRSLKPPTSRQLAQRQKFALAVFKTRTWLAQRAKKIFLQGLERKWGAYSTYHAGIRYFMTQADPTPTAAVTTTETPTAATQPPNAPASTPATVQAANTATPKPSPLPHKLQPPDN